MKREWLVIVLWIAIFILIRSLHFTAGLNFSQDQASDSLHGLDLLRAHKITLIGTQTGYNYHGRLLFQGPLFIYTYMAYNLLGGFNPIISSYIFMLTGSLAIIPLYFGMKRLTNTHLAILSIVLYSLVPYFINYTKFMWNPNFQFILTPVLIYFFALYHTQKSLRWLLVLSITAGALLQYHYQFVVIITALGIYLLSQISRLKNFFVFVAGLAIGFSPVLLFELRNGFYNLNTVVIYLQHYDEVFIKNGSTSVSPHFFLSISLVVCCVVLVLLKKHIKKSYVVIAIVFLLPFTEPYLKVPDRMYNSTIQWKLENELKVYDIISKYNLKETNISHLDYDNIAVVQKYFLARDNKQFYDDYYNNKYLFAVSKTDKLSQYKAYEIASFSPRKIVKSWPISSIYTLYLLERTNKPI